MYTLDLKKQHCVIIPPEQTNDYIIKLICGEPIY